MFGKCVSERGLCVRVRAACVSTLFLLKLLILIIFVECVSCVSSLFLVSRIFEIKCEKGLITLLLRVCVVCRIENTWHTRHTSYKSLLFQWLVFLKLAHSVGTHLAHMAHTD